jgi:hypothetical protein
VIPDHGAAPKKAASRSGNSVNPASIAGTSPRVALPIACYHSQVSCKVSAAHANALRMKRETGAQAAFHGGAKPVLPPQR